MVAECLPAGPDLAGWLGSSSAANLEDGALPGVAAAYRRLASWAQAGELAAVAQMASRSAAADPKAGVDGQGRPSRVPADAHGQVSLALTMSQSAAAWWTDLAVGLQWRLAGTGVALRSGAIDLGRAKAIAEATAVLDDEKAQAVESNILARAGEQTMGQLRAALRRAVIKADPEGAERRREEAERQARVMLYPDAEGTASLSGQRLSAVRAAAAMSRITALAQALKASGAGGGIDLLRGHVFLGLLLGTLPYIPPPLDAPPDDPPSGDGTPDDGTPDDLQLDDDIPPPDLIPADGPWPDDAPREDESREDAPREDESREDAPREDESREDAPREDEWPEDAPREDEWPEDAPREDEWPEDAPREDEWPDFIPVDDLRPDDDIPPPDAGPADGNGCADGGLLADGDDSPGAGRLAGRGAGGEVPAAGSGGVPPWPEATALLAPGPAAMGFLLPVGSGFVDLAIPWLTLVGRAGEPGYLTRLGPVTPAQASYLALLAAADPAVDWRVVLTDEAGRAVAVTRARLRRRPARAGPAEPGRSDHRSSLVRQVTVTLSLDDLALAAAGGAQWAGGARRVGDGNLAAVLAAILAAAGEAVGRATGQAAADAAAGGCAHARASLAYQPPPGLREFVAVRDLTCRFPTCRQPAWRCDLDHTEPYDQDGLTCSCNLGGLCRYHHKLKQHPRWRLIQPNPGTFAWITPTGRTYVIGPDSHAA
jgi:hypothetical protein